MKKIYNIHINYNNLTSSEKLGEGSITVSEDTERFYLTDKSDGWHINSEDIKNAGLSNLFSNTNIDLQDKKIYRFPNLRLPRQKVDLLKEKYNVKVIRDIDKADVHIISVKTIEKLLNTHWGNITTFKEFFRVIRKMIDENLVSGEEYKRLQLLVNDMDKESMVYFNRNSYYGNNDVIRRISGKISRFSEGGVTWKKGIFINTDNVKHYNNIINSNKQVVSDLDISNIIDSELAVIDNTQFDDVHAMLTSDDKENTALAVEMLANCNIEKSFDVVSNLYFWNYDSFRYSTNWNTINVKSLRSRLTDYQGGHSTQQIWAFNKYIKLLKEDRKLTKWAIDNTRKLLLKTHLNHIVGKDASVFKVDLENIYLNEEYQL
tara:strand:+ start:276 stop:1400 length:1125 start_codon:yes stop_codon:yes gene_type:complete